MKTQRNHLGIIVLVVTLFVASVGVAQPGKDAPNERPEMGRQHRPHHGPLLRGLHHLDLTEDQKGQIETILEDNKEGTEAAHTAVKEAHQAMAEAVESEDEAAIKAAAANIGTAIGEAAVIRLTIVKAIKSVLTEEQLAELAKIKEKAKKWQEEGKFRRGPRKGPGRSGPRHDRQGPRGPQ